MLAIDPPIERTSEHISYKYALAVALPLGVSSDRVTKETETVQHVYLCNPSIPKKVFENVGIKYTSPFGEMFVVRLSPQPKKEPEEEKWD